MALLIWLPSASMGIGFVVIWYRLRQSKKAFPYMSVQSRIARSRRKVINMLGFLLALELICWFPWMMFTIIESIVFYYKPKVRFLGPQLQRRGPVHSTHRGHIGDALGTHWGRIGDAFGTHLVHFGNALETQLGRIWGRICDSLGDE